MSLSCLLTGRRKAILLFGNWISCIIIYVMNNLVNPRAWWQCSIKITVLFVGRCLPGKFHQVDSASAAGSLRRVTFMSCAQNVKIICFSVRTYFRSFNAETCLLEVALNRILYRWDWSNLRTWIRTEIGIILRTRIELELKLDLKNWIRIEIGIISRTEISLVSAISVEILQSSLKL